MIRLRKFILALALGITLLLPLPRSLFAAGGQPSSALPRAASVGTVPTIVQTLNNCGPASIASVLAYWGIARSQEQVQVALRADNSPRGMAPFGVPAYARSVGLRSLLGVAGTLRLIKVLVARHFPVIVNQLVAANDPIRHYRPIVAYDDRRGVFVSSDPYLGVGHQITYSEFSRIWSISDDRFLILYPASRQQTLSSALRQAGWRLTPAYQHDLLWEQDRMRHPRPAESPYWSWYYAYPSLAWDEMELGRWMAARADLNLARTHGASPVVLGWIERELQRRQRS